MNKLEYRLRIEASVFHPRLHLAQLLAACLPLYVGGSVRAMLLRLAGFSIGHETVFWGMPTIVGTEDIYPKLIIGNYCKVGAKAFLDLADNIVFRDWVTLGPEVMLITGTHEIGSPGNRLGKLVPKPVCIGSGAWLGARCTVLPGVTIGDGAVVGAGAIVNRDVPPHTLVAGVPAVAIRKLDDQAGR
jgi:maltose O-acetyltransferase